MSKRRLLAAAALVLLGGMVAAAPGRGADGLELDFTGVVIDRTITRLGHEFYYHFAAAWFARYEPDGYNLVVTETPSAAWGSIIRVQQDGDVVYSTVIRPGRGNVKALAEEATRTVYEKIAVKIRTPAPRSRSDLSASGY